MPRNKRHGNMAVIDERPPTEVFDPTITQETDMSTATIDETDTDDAVVFDIVSEPAPEDYSPDRKTPGRERKPSYFDDVLRANDVFGCSWQRVATTSDEHKAYVLRELNRAKLFLNGTGKGEGEPEIGLDLDTGKEDAVYFKSRVAQKRERKSENGSAALAAEAEADELASDTNGDNDE